MRSFVVFSLAFAIVLLAISLMDSPCWGAIKADIAVSRDASGWFQPSKKIPKIVDNLNGKVSSIQLFPFEEQEQLAEWVKSHTNNGQLDVLILCGIFPVTIYPSGNAEPDGSIAERFLDAGNMIINSGGYMFFATEAGDANSNGAAGLQNMMDIPEIDMWDGSAVNVTDLGREYLPSLAGFQTERAFPLDMLLEPWETEAIFACNAARILADPVVVHNTETDGRLAISYQTGNMANEPRVAVMTEFILNWLPTILPEAVESEGKLSILWGQLKLGD